GRSTARAPAERAAGPRPGRPHARSAPHPSDFPIDRPMAFSDSLLILLLALAAEAAIGYPDGLYTRIGHPVTWIGQLIKILDRGLNRDEWTFGHRRAAGILALLILLTITGGVAWVLQSLLLPLGMIGVAVLAILASS